jgi:hypothetical protein
MRLGVVATLSDGLGTLPLRRAKPVLDRRGTNVEQLRAKGGQSEAITGSRLDLDVALKVLVRGRFRLERVTGIEPALSAWEADVLPLNYTRATPRPSRSQQSGANDPPTVPTSRAAVSCEVTTAVQVSLHQS